MAALRVIIWALLVHSGLAQSRLPLEDFEVEEDSFGSTNDVKDNFFEHIGNYENDIVDAEIASEFVALPRPGGFNIYAELTRAKRDTKDPNFDVIQQITADVERRACSGTGSVHNGKQKSEQPIGEEVAGVNDFVRFRRDTPDNDQVSKLIKQEEESAANPQNHRELLDLNTFVKRQSEERTGKMLFHEGDPIPEGPREPRGATKEQWIKQPYPVRSISIDSNNYEDSDSSATDVRAPRVHFITQRRLESSPSTVSFGSFDREGRARDYAKPAREPARGTLPRKLDRNYYPDRPLKHYDPYPPRSFPPYRDDPYYRYEESRYDPAEYDRRRPEYSARQRRIIYYATLPEVVRSPPNVNLRDRYNYRDRYDDRYVADPALAPADGGSYRFRKPLPYVKSRYENEMERAKAPYPLKVSADVNVREAKKNPERRIYSELDRRYAQRAPSYQSEETFDRRT